MGAHRPRPDAEIGAGLRLPPAVAEGTERQGAFFGRRQGKPLRPGQSERFERLIPELRIDPDVDPRASFPQALAGLRLEIGFGGGEHLAAQARASPDIGFIGCEAYRNGIAKLVAVIEQEGLRNIRLWDGDATDLLPELPDGSIDGVDLLYPDPWPKRRQRKRRIVSDAFLTVLARVMRPGAKFRFATDIDDYAGWTLARALRSPGFAWEAARPDDWRKPWVGWPGTCYESKALREGRRPSYLTFRRLS